MPQTNKPIFALVIGGAGSGKNHYIENNPAFAGYKMIDVDQIKKRVPLHDAIAAVKTQMTQAFVDQQNVVHPTTGSNLTGQRNKVYLALSHGYFIHLIFIDTPPEVAAERVRQRQEAGGHGVRADAILSSNNKARANFISLSQIADKTSVV